MKLVISKKVKEKFPDIELVLRDINNVKVIPNENVIQEKNLEAEVNKSKKPGFYDEPYFLALRDFYKEIGLDPEIEPPAAENLYRNFIRKGSFAKINNVVDSSNLSSIKTYVPLGVFDSDRIEGDMVLRFSESGEEFNPLGGRTEVLPEGIMVISDQKRIFSKFPYRDAVHAAISEKTTNIVIIGDKVKGFDKKDVINAVNQTADYILQFAGGKIGAIFFSEDETEGATLSYVAAIKKTPQKFQRVFSGIRATGRLHLGNYLGAVKGMLDLQDSGKYETIYCVVDVHTITTPYQAEILRKNKREIIIDYLAAGLDPEKSILIYQSEVPEHTELAFYFSSIVTIARMQHLPTFKDKVKQYPKNVTMALLNYPILMAADILVYKAGLVPVGIDQEPHLEIAREIARKMNLEFGMDFPEPVRFITKGEYIPSLKGEGKMSKSVEGSYINLTDSLEDIRKKIRSIPTATVSGGDLTPGLKSLFAFSELFMPDKTSEFKKQFESGSLQFSKMKDDISESIHQELQPFQIRRKEIEKDQAFVDTVIKEGAEKARTIASQTVKEVREKMGLL